MVPKVLVVDDTASIRFLIRTNLELAGFEVAEAVDGADCLEFLRTAEVLPDAMTVDVMMPQLAAIATVSAVRADPRTKDIAIVMVTTQGHPADIQRATQAGVDAYVTKPFDPDALMTTVAEAIEHSRNRGSD